MMNILQRWGFAAALLLMALLHTDVQSWAQAPGTVSFSSATYTVSEDGQRAVITAVRAGGAFGFVTARFLIQGGTAALGEDYELGSGVFRFPNGVNVSTITVPIIQDGETEGDEFLNLAISSPTGGAFIGSPSAAVLIITDSASGPGTGGTDPPGSGPGEDDTCATYDLFANLLRIPHFNFGGISYRLEMQPIPGDTLAFIVTDFGLSEVTADGATYDFFSNTLHVPCLDLGSATYWMDLTFVPGDSARFELADFGVNP
jgi:hypothetical protein